MYAFDYHRPASVADAAKLLKDGAKILAGGQTLIPTLKLRLASPSALVDMRGIADMRGVSQTGANLVIGAMTTHAEVADSKPVQAALPGLAAVATGIGDPHVRNRGTIGGSLANNDPAADYPAAVLALGATIVTNKRQIAADDFFQGLFATALAEDEIITAVSIPTGGKFGYAKFANPASRFALVGVAVAQSGSAVRVAVTGAGANGVFRATAMEAALGKSFQPGALDGLAVDASQLSGDLHADAAYRANLVKVMAKRAVAAAV